MSGRTIPWALLALTTLGLVGCSSSSSSWTAKGVMPGAGEEANVILFLSNQSSARQVVTMSVHVDGQLALRRTMRDVMAGCVHVFPEEFGLRLSPGSHTIRVVAEGLAESDTAEVVVGAKPVYVDAAYDFWPEHHGVRSPGEIAINVGHERPGFC